MKICFEQPAIRALIVGLACFLSLVPAAASEPHVCAPYRQGPLTENKIVIFHSGEERLLPEPPRWQPIRYRYEYVRRPHLKGAIGYPYETGIGFEINVNTGQPIAQTGPDRNRLRQATDHFRVSIDGASWLPIEDYIGTYTQQPINAPFPTKSYHELGQSYGMKQVTYVTPERTVPVGIAERRFYDREEFYVEESEEGEIIAFMKCGRPGVIPVPHCRYFSKLPPFNLDVYFNRRLLPQIDDIRTHAVNFVSCLMEEYREDGLFELRRDLTQGPNDPTSWRNSVISKSDILEQKEIELKNSIFKIYDEIIPIEQQAIYLRENNFILRVPKHEYIALSSNWDVNEIKKYYRDRGGVCRSLTENQFICNREIEFDDTKYDTAIAFLIGQKNVRITECMAMGIK